MNCDVCGKETMMPDGDETLGMSVQFIISSTFDGVKDKAYLEFVKRQMGPYEPNRKYRICWECLLRALGVKPQERGGEESVDSKRGLPRAEA